MQPRSSLRELATGRARAFGQRSRRMATAFAVPAVAAWLMYNSGYGVQPGQAPQTMDAPAPSTQVAVTNGAARSESRAAGDTGGNWISRKFLAALGASGATQPVARPAVKAATRPEPNPASGLPAANQMTLPASALTVSLPQTDVYNPNGGWQTLDYHPTFATVQNSPTPSVRELPAPTVRGTEMRSYSSMPPAQPSRIRPVDLPTKVAGPYFPSAPQSLRASRAQLMASRPPGGVKEPVSESGPVEEFTFEPMPLIPNYIPEDLGSAMSGFLASRMGEEEPAAVVNVSSEL
jgi:hypothetical protein